MYESYNERMKELNRDIIILSIWGFLFFSQILGIVVSFILYRCAIISAPVHSYLAASTFLYLALSCAYDFFFRDKEDSFFGFFD